MIGPHSDFPTDACVTSVSAELCKGRGKKLAGAAVGSYFIIGVIDPFCGGNVVVLRDLVGASDPDVSTSLARMPGSLDPLVQSERLLELLVDLL